MSWNFMQVELVPADLQVRSLIGAGGMTHAEAVAEVQRLLDAAPHLARTAAIWQRGAKDDTVYAGSLIWCIYEHEEREDSRRAALAWLEDLADTMRGAGLDIQIARFQEEAP